MVGSSVGEEGEESGGNYNATLNVFHIYPMLKTIPWEMSEGRDRITSKENREQGNYTTYSTLYSTTLP